MNGVKRPDVTYYHILILQLATIEIKDGRFDRLQDPGKTRFLTKSRRSGEAIGIEAKLGVCEWRKHVIPSSSSIHVLH